MFFHTEDGKFHTKLLKIDLLTRFSQHISDHAICCKQALWSELYY